MNNMSSKIKYIIPVTIIFVCNFKIDEKILKNLIRLHKLSIIKFGREIVHFVASQAVKFYGLNFKRSVSNHT